MIYVMTEEEEEKNKEEYGQVLCFFSFRYSQHALKTMMVYLYLTNSN